MSFQQSLTNHEIPAYGFWEGYLKNGIAEAGHQWTEAVGVDWAEGLALSDPGELSRWRERTWSLALASIGKEHAKRPIDLFLAYLYPRQVEEGAIREIQKLGIPCLNFFCDNVREFSAVPDRFRCFDLHWVPEYKAQALYRAAGLPYLHAPMPLWISPGLRTCGHPETYGVSFIGSRDAQRERLLARVVASGIPLEIRGAGWSTGSPAAAPRVKTPGRNPWRTLLDQKEFLARNGPVPFARKLVERLRPGLADALFACSLREKPGDLQYPEIMQQSLITLGVNRYPSFHHPFARPDSYSRLRDLEAPMLGACYLTEWTEGLDRLYEPGREIECYRSPEELVEKILYLQASPAKRRSLRALGQRRALAEHTISKSLTRIFNALGRG